MRLIIHGDTWWSFVEIQHALFYSRRLTFMIGVRTNRNLFLQGFYFRPVGKKWNRETFFTSYYVFIFIFISVEQRNGKLQWIKTCFFSKFKSAILWDFTLVNLNIYWNHVKSLKIYCYWKQKVKQICRNRKIKALCTFTIFKLIS